MNKQFKQDDRVVMRAVPYEGLTGTFVRYLPSDRRPNGMDCEIVVDGDTDTISPYRSDDIEFDQETIGEICEREGTEDYVIGSELVILIRRKRMLEAMLNSAKEGKDEAEQFAKVDPELFQRMTKIEKDIRIAHGKATHELEQYCSVSQG